MRPSFLKYSHLNPTDKRVALGELFTSIYFPKPQYKTRKTNKSVKIQTAFQEVFTGGSYSVTNNHYLARVKENCDNWKRSSNKIF